MLELFFGCKELYLAVNSYIHMRSVVNVATTDITCLDDLSPTNKFKRGCARKRSFFSGCDVSKCV